MEYAEFAERLRKVRAKVTKQLGSVRTEEGTKNAFVMPFLNALGYNVFNPMEVEPEFTADIGTKKGEKVDYAVKKDGIVIILVECKAAHDDLHDDQAYQLRRYFDVTDARLAILTNGITYRFYSDLEKNNIMDEKPFYEVDLRRLDEHSITELMRFSKWVYDPDKVLQKASELKYLRQINTELNREISVPTPEFAKLIAGRMYSGHRTKSVVEKFQELIATAFEETIRRKVQERLQSALEKESNVEHDSAESGGEDNDDDGIVTTEEELQGFYIVQAIASEVIDVARVAKRDVKSYFSVLLDDNNRKPICRLHFDSAQKYVGLFHSAKEERHPIDDVSDIFQYRHSILEAIRRYEDA